MYAYSIRMYLLINQRHYVSALSTANNFIFIYVEVTTLQNEVEYRVCRQSDMLFLQSSELAPPHQGASVSPPFGSGGGAQ